jgi:hypothetical protein
MQETASDTILLATGTHAMMRTDRISRRANYGLIKGDTGHVKPDFREREFDCTSQGTQICCLPATAEIQAEQ